MLSCRDHLFAYQLLAIEMLVYAGLIVLLIVAIVSPPFVDVLRKLVSLKKYSSKCHKSLLVLVANQGHGQGGAPPPVSLEGAHRHQGTRVIRDLHAPKVPASPFTPLLCSLKRSDVTLKKYNAALLIRRATLLTLASGGGVGATPHEFF